MLTFLLAAIFVASFEGAVSCPNGFEQHDESCYKIFHIRGSWSEARGYCRVFNSDLASIQDEREHNFLAGQLGRDGAAAFRPGRFWLDANDLLSEGDWIWESTSQNLQSTYSNWATGQPSNTNNAEHCLSLDFANNLKWNDEDCELKNNFICEVSATGGDIIGR